MKNTVPWSSVRSEILSDPTVKKEYDLLSSEFEMVENIIRLRQKQKISQKELAERMGTTQSVIARVESGKANPTIRFLHRVADALGTSLSIQFR